ncbi:MAG: DNA-binding transcriptional regulator Fis [Moraxellaceae bacterium]|nr:DNA-binding transcriptional regulator Fis [Moraxellaceae bacterium]HCT42056.1 DNA-binding transcriptional regulator Fis [Moraxellaceae bacterium]
MDISTLKQQFTSSPSPAQKTLRDHVEYAMRNYFANLNGEQVTNVYDMVLAEIEGPLLEVVLEYTRGNQTRASEILGLNRGTLRKKLKDHGLM